jgi:hypothetical protein
MKEGWDGKEHTKIHALSIHVLCIMTSSELPDNPKEIVPPSD